MSSEEIWKDIPGYVGLYQVSTLGNVRSIVVSMGRRKRILSPGKTKWGYLQVSLADVNGVKKHVSVHRAVCLAFIPIPENLRPYLGTRYLQVNHKDEDKLNNRVENLEWCTPKYNTNYGSVLQKRLNTKNKNGSIGSFVKVNQLAEDGTLIKTWDSMVEAASALNIHRSQICQCCKGKLHTVGGFKWEYADGRGVFNHSAETIKKMKAYQIANSPMRGVKFTPAQIEKCRLAHKGRPVGQYDVNGKLVKKWRCAPDAARCLHLDNASIHRVCRGERHAKTLGGYVWKYLD